MTNLAEKGQEEMRQGKVSVGRPKDTGWEEREWGERELLRTKRYYVPATRLITFIDYAIGHPHLTDVKTEDPERISDLPRVTQPGCGPRSSRPQILGSSH